MTSSAHGRELQGNRHRRDDIVPEFFWILPLLIIFAVRSGGRRHRWGRDGAERDYIAALEQQSQEQQDRIADLEARLARVEEGLDFAERVLAERARPTLSP